MSYPQTSPNTSVLSGQDYWRLFTPLASAGDIYESEQSGRGFVIGPDSDIARVKIVYYDIQNPNLANEAIVSIDKPFVGRLDAFGDQTYNTGDQARLFISAEDFVPYLSSTSFFAPPTSAGAVVEIVPPSIDLIQYLGEVPAFVPPRSDKVFRFDQLTNISNDQQWFLVPFYGRRFFDVGVKTLGFDGSTTPPIDVGVYGINYSPSVGGGVLRDTGVQQEMLDFFSLASPATNAGISEFAAGSSRSFDYLGVMIQKPVGSADYPIETVVSTRITVSDKV